MRVGIPRGLLYYQYLPMWATFFRELGVEVVTSPATTEQMLALGCSRSVGDLCLPVKVFFGHVFSLANDCDYVFVPAIHSPRQGVNSCPKFIGLPDLVRAIVPECPPLLDPDVDLNDGNRGLGEVAYEIGTLFTPARSKVEAAVRKALEASRAFRALMLAHRLSPPQAIEKMFPGFGEEVEAGDPTSDITVALIGHRYLLHDHHISHRLEQRLRKLGVNTVIAETVDEDRLRASMLELVDQPYWAYEEEIIGAGAHYLRSDVDGIIAVAAFGCGPDSMMLELVQRGAGRVGKRFLKLVFDEHTAEGGLVTRLEAFVDMVRRARHQPAQPARHARLRAECSDEREGIGALGIPNMGNIAPALRTSAEMLGVRLIVPQVTKRTLSLGVRHSPEFACVPFKVILGCFVECLESGADTLFMVTSSNACRMGYYSKVHEEILRDLGYEFKFLRHHSSEKGILGVLRTIRGFTNNAPWLRVLSAYRLGTAKLRALDDLERKATKIRPVALDKVETERVLREAIDAVDKAVHRSSVKRAAKVHLRELEHLPIDRTLVPPRVGVVGEFYVVLEPFVNLNLEVELGKLGVEVTRTRTTYLSEWTSARAYLNVLSKEKRKLAKYAEPYLKRDVGGHGLESLAEKVRLARAGYDGVVHVTPFTCMPETIAQNIMPRTKENIPVLTMVCDEQVTKAGVLTRLEAFVDLLESRRRNSNGKRALV